MVPAPESGLSAAGRHVVPSNRSQFAAELQTPLAADRKSPFAGIPPVWRARAESDPKVRKNREMNRRVLFGRDRIMAFSLHTRFEQVRGQYSMMPLKRSRGTLTRGGNSAVHVRRATSRKLNPRFLLWRGCRLCCNRKIRAAAHQLKSNRFAGSWMRNVQKMNRGG
jgi:hypothetical protein